MKKNIVGNNHNGGDIIMLFGVSTYLQTETDIIVLGLPEHIPK